MRIVIVDNPNRDSNVLARVRLVFKRGPLKGIEIFAGVVRRNYRNDPVFVWAQLNVYGTVENIFSSLDGKGLEGLSEKIMAAYHDQFVRAIQESFKSQKDQQ